MLAAAALRLAAVEALCPHNAIQSGIGYPTLAEWRVYDSVQIGVGDLDQGAPYTPAISLYTEDTRIERRGPTATSSIGNASTDLVVVVELAESARDENGNPISDNGGQVTDAVINGDANMRLILEALSAQVRSVLVRAPHSAGLRRIMKSVQLVRIEPFALPQFGIRFMRNVMTFSCDIADDKFTDLDGLPEPLRTAAEELPAGSYAKAKLQELSAAFQATNRDALEAIGLVATANDAPAMPGTPTAP